MGEKDQTGLRRTRVAHLVEDLKVGGMEKVIASIALGLDQRKFAAEIWCLSRGGAVAEWLAQEGVPVRVFAWPSYHNPLNILRLARRLRAARMEVVHTHGYYAGTFGRLAALAARIPAVFAHIHTADFALSVRHHLIERILSFFSQRVICISQHVKSFVVSRQGVRPAKTILVYNGTGRLFVGPADDPPPGPRRRSDGEVVIVSVGSLVANKGHHILLEALRLLLPDWPAIKLFIAGDGPQRSALEEIVHRNGLSSAVEFVGVLKDVRRLLRAADIFILPTVRREGLSLAVLEAMHVGLPVIASRIGGVPELVDEGSTGLLVTPNDPVRLSRAIGQLAADEKRRRRMGAAGRQKIDRLFSSERMVSQIEDLYHTACRRL